MADWKMPAKTATISGGKGHDSMPQDRQLAALERRYQRLAARLASPGLLLQGTISEVRPRRVVSPRTGQTKTYGPYYQWTWKEAGKTVTVNLAASQRRVFARAIANQRRVEQTLAAMRELSRQILELSTEGVVRRKR
jgi:hypothetical protein